MKSIHHFSAHYYTDRGQLLNATRQYRKEKKARRLMRQQTKTEINKSRSGSLVSKGVSDEKEMDSEDDSDKSSEEDDNSDSKLEASVIRKKKKTYPKDMYKVFDGSVLMALGNLLFHIELTHC